MSFWRWWADNKCNMDQWICFFLAGSRSRTTYQSNIVFLNSWWNFGGFSNFFWKSIKGFKRNGFFHGDKFFDTKTEIFDKFHSFLIFEDGISKKLDKNCQTLMALNFWTNGTDFQTSKKWNGQILDPSYIQICQNAHIWIWICPLTNLDPKH